MSNAGSGIARSFCLSLRNSNNKSTLLPSIRFIHPLSSDARPLSIAVASRTFGLCNSLRNTDQCQAWTSHQRSNFHSGRWLLTPKRSENASKLPRPKNDKTRIQLGSVSQDELRKAFSQDLSLEDGNTILQILQERRKSGSLVEFGISLDEQYKHVPQDATAAALKWLRKNFPVDEQQAAAQYADREEQKAQELGLDTRNVEEPEDRDISQTARTTHSVLDRYKKYNEEKKAAEEARLKESPEFQKNQELRMVHREELDRKRQLAREKRQKNIEYWSDRAKGRDKLPDLPWWRRLLPGTFFAATMIACITIAADFYVPPTAAERIFPWVSPAVATITGIIAVNVLVWGLWKMPPMWRYMNMYFLQVPGYPYALSLLGNTLSHIDMPHLWVNMSGLLIYGYFLHEDIGRGNFLGLYFSSAIFASAGSLWYYVLTKNWAYYSRGASGAVWGVMAAWAVFTASQSAKPRDSWGFYVDVALFATLVTQLAGQFAPGIMRTHDIPAHLFGAIWGIIASYYLKTQTARRAREAEKMDERIRTENSRSGVKIDKKDPEDDVNWAKNSMEKMSIVKR